MYIIIVIFKSSPAFDTVVENHLWLWAMMLEHTSLSLFILLKDTNMSVVSLFLKYSVLCIHTALITSKKMGNHMV